MSLDKPEEIVASKRVDRWSQEDREWLDALTPSEREAVLLLVAHLDARPVVEEEPRD